MGMGTGGGNKKAISDINVTPLVDVMLVLLIIFMVATPMIVENDAERMLDIDLPPTVPAPPETFNPEERLILEIDEQLRVVIGETLITDCSAAVGNPVADAYEPCFDELEERLRNNPRLAEDENLYLLADTNIPYGFVVGAMNRIRLAGVTNVGMVTNPEYLTDEQRSMVPE